MTGLLNEGFGLPTVLDAYNIEAITGGVSRSTTIKKDGTASCKFYINEADTGYGGGSSPHRAEIHSNVEEFTFNQDYWLGVNVYLENWTSDPEPEQIIQFHNVPNFGAGETWGTLKLMTPFGIQIKNNVYEVVHGFVQDSDAANPNGTLANNRVSAGAINNNGWTKWVIHCRWHYSTGILEVWKDDVLVYSKTGNTYYNDETGPYHKVGIYKWSWVYVGNISTTTERTMYLDNWKIVQGADAGYNDVNPTTTMATSTLANIKVIATEPGNYQAIHRVSSGLLKTEKVIDFVVKPDPTPPTPPVSPYPTDASVTGVTPALTLAQFKGLGYGQSIIDTTYGDNMRITKVTDRVIFGRANMGKGYSKVQSWNADGSLACIGRQDIINGTYPYAYNHKIPGSSMFGLWSNTDPDIRYLFASARVIYTYSPSTKTRTLLYDFASEGFDNVPMTVGNFEGNIDNNDEFVILNFKEGGIDRNVLFNLQTASIVWNKSNADLGLPTGYFFDWLSVSQSGNYIVGAVKNASGVAVYKQSYNRATGAVVQANLGILDHRDCGYDSSGNEVLVGTNYPAMHNLTTAAATNIVTSATWATAFGAGANKAGGHSTARNINLPGWAGFSVSSLANTVRPIFLAKLDGSQTVRMFCPSYTSCANGDRVPVACPNQDGTKFIFTSDGGDAKGDIHSYIVEKVV